MFKYLISIAVVLILSCTQDDIEGDTTSTITFENNTFTPLTLKFQNEDYKIAENEFLEFTSQPGSNYSYSASTRGLYLDFVSFSTTNVIGPKAGAKTRVEFTIPEDFFYMTVKNNSTTPVVRVDIYFDNRASGLGGKPVIANNGSLYGVGYLSVHANSITFKSVDCRTCSDVPGSYWYFGDGSDNSLDLIPQPIPTLSNTENQNIVFELK